MVFHGEKWGALWLVFCRQALNQELLNLLSFRRFGICGTQSSFAQGCHQPPRSGVHV